MEIDDISKSIENINKDISNINSVTYKRYTEVTRRLDMKNRGIYIMVDGNERPNSNGAYLCVSHGKQGMDWNYIVDVYTLYGDSIPRYFFKIYSYDGINYFADNYQKYIMDSDLNTKLSVNRILANCEEVSIDSNGWGHITFARELGHDWYITLFAYPPGWNFISKNANKNGFDVQVLINDTPVKNTKLWITWLALTP